ncbi:Leucine-rich repeat (LRR) protein [Flavobacterium granuli]|uniref:Leucine-rich repeat (LRR) protein n=1 Tax=Flavobacterium granuli TaxID=280093 RepID=A0ABU1S442_9FLAO|nr:Leucine-rich repeat (LRR) protein [Flavobacterium granuli]
MYSYSNQLTALDLNNNILLETLIAFSNQITSLDLSKNSNLNLVYLDNNPLSYLNIQNGNNKNFILPSVTNKKNATAFYTSFLTSGTLSCIQVDDPIYSNANWSSIKNNTVNFNTDCATSNLYTYIPDVNFENKLISLGIDSGVADGKVLTSNVDKLTALDVSSSSISDLTGIQDFTSLKELICNVNNLTMLDVSKNLALTSLECSYNKLSALDVSKNLSLESLRCEVNYITSLDVSNNLSLGALYCYTNLLSDLDVSKNLSLVTLYFDNNKISTIDVSKNTILGALSYSGNNVTTIDVSKNSSLGFLNCQSNQVTNLDLSHNLMLNSLFCNDNQITELDLSKHIYFIFLLCQNNKLLNLNLKNGSNVHFDTQLLNFTGNPDLTCIQVDDETYSNANWAGAKDVTASYSTNCNPYTLIPDSNFEQKLIDLGIDTDGLNGKVDRSRINTLTSLDVSEKEIKSLKGIEDFADLTTLNCSSNQLSVLDISKNTALETLHCSYNQLTTLDVSKNTGLMILNCFSNQLTALDIKNQTMLRSLDCSFNQLGVLDISTNKYLYSLNCSSNQLTTLDVSINTGLTSLICTSNQLTTLDISNQKELNYLGCSSNQLTALDITKNTALWSLSCDSNQLTALDIRANTELEALYCSSNQLTALDISNQTKLIYLDCSSNQITALDVSNHKDLWNFSCNSNQLTYLNLKNGYNSHFNTISFIDNPKLTCIQVDNAIYSNTNWADKKDATANYNVDCPLYALIPDSSFEQKLIDLGIDTDGLNGKITPADVNSITTLDLSNSNITDLTGIENFTALTTLNCSNNQLISLDLSKNTNLQILYVTGNPLVYINLKNGNNQNLIVESQTAKNTANTQGTSFLGLTSLGCVKVDSVAYSNTNWSKIKESTTIYSETCTLGIEDSVFDKVAIYPNPAKGELHIDNIVLEKATVYDALGKLIKTTTFTSGANDNTLHLEGFPTGVYYIYLESEGANTAKKIIVE